ncbi:hypothetical protein GQ54DRAFT_104637 [Martensiomyces pterosporus]|nr:hypothetical protein GQ54DRAFT_104637 [Martensiomyces pterosporus]
MIDSLIKDANSALSSKPDIHRAAASGYSDDCVDFPSNDSPFASKDISRTVSAPFDEAATLVVDTDFARKHHHSPYVATASEIKRPVSRSTTRRAFDYSSDHLLARRPASAHGMSVKGRRHLVPRTHAMAGSCESSSDPTEADGESDGYLGAMSTAGHYHVRHSRHHRSSGRHLDRRTSSNRFVRYRSDTTDSLVSNSSETCVAPSTRVSRELHRPSMASTYSQPPTTVDALCTPGRASFGMGGDEAMFSEQQQQRRRQPIEQSPALSASRMHEFPRLVQDEYEGGAHRRSYSRDDTYAGSIPLIRRFRNSVTRVALKSASLVDESVSNDIAAYESSGRGSMDGVHQPRMRSNTSVSEISTVFTPPRHPAMAADYGYQMPTSAGIESPVWERRDLLLDDAHVYPSSFHEEPAASSPLLWTRRHRSTMGSPGIAASSDEIPRKRWSLEASPGSERSSIEYSPEIDPRGYSSQTAGAMYQHQQLRTALSSGHPVRRPDSIEEYDSSCESNAVEKSRGGHEVATAGSTSATGLIGMVSLLYWTLLFTLGALMLDSFLCQVAGKRVMGTVDKIAQAEAASDDGDSRKKKGLVSMDRAAPAGRRPEADGANVANTVGRFVRWYVEGPEEQLLQKGQQSPRPTAGAAGAGRGGLGLGSSGQQPRSLRARKPSAMRGTFKHVG